LNPAIKVSAADSAANKETAEIIEGMIRHIEYKSDATSIYEAATESAAACSVGYWRIRADYCDGVTFDQEAMIERIYNPFAVFPDPFAKHPTRMDARYGFIIEEVPKEDFAKQYPDATIADITSDHRVARMEQWGGAEKVVVAEYFWIEHKDVEIIQVGGQVGRVKDLPPGFIDRDPATGKPYRRRTMQEPQVKWAKITANDVLDGPRDFPSRYIPIVAVTGEEWHLGEETYRSSVIRFAKDPQMLYNYARSTQAEVTGMQPKAPFLITADQVAGHEGYWAEAGTKNRPYLPYNADPNAGAPQRINPPIASQALMSEMQIAAEDIKRTTGIYDASLGARSNETSGKAILARKEESQNATSVYADNMVKAITQTGVILVDMIPRIYDAKRMVRVLGEDGQEKIETINAMVMSLEGPMPVNDVSLGKYDVKVAVGPSYSSRREETLDGMMRFMEVYPEARGVMGDLVAKMQEWSEKDRVAERLRKIAPPGVIEDDDAEPTPEQMQAKQQQMQQMQAEQAMQQEAQGIAKAEAIAKTRKAEAEARKAEAEAELKEIEAAMKRGDVRALVEASVEQTAAELTMRQAPVM
jgi:regulator of protease activity HflC (stomatin/prohibitin superfamily)